MKISSGGRSVLEWVPLPSVSELSQKVFWILFYQSFLDLSILLSDFLIPLDVLGLGRNMGRLFPRCTPVKVPSPGVLCSLEGGYPCTAGDSMLW